jgi:hypothetical protein
MSHIPETAMPHAKAHDEDAGSAAPQASGDTAQGAADTTLADKASDAAARATAVMKSNPKTTIGLGTALGVAAIAGIVTAVAAPTLLAKGKAGGKKAKETGKKAKAK